MLLALLLTVAAGAAWAHAARLFATVEGGAIVGEVYFAGGGPAAAVGVVAVDPDGNALAQARTDAEGRFRLPVTRRVDHRLLADVGDGHAASALVPADALPEPAATPSSAAAREPAAVAAAVDAALARRVAPLRRDIARLQDRILWRDVLGGLGYVLGLFGAAAFVLARRRDRQPPG